HLSAYLPNALFLEYNVASSSLLNTLCTVPIQMIDGAVTVPNDPGLGVEVNEDILKRFRVQ
ncbi:MAG TPA: enolase C-terminal domain-like protein, partial [Thermomicrobiales bacterium]